MQSARRLDAGIKQSCDFFVFAERDLDLPTDDMKIDLSPTTTLKLAEHLVAMHSKLDVLIQDLRHNSADMMKLRMDVQESMEEVNMGDQT